MIKQQKRENIKALFSVLDSYAETPEAKQCIRHFTSEAETNLDEMTLELVNAIHDGLAYGNWPWVIAAFKGFK